MSFKSPGLKDLTKKKIIKIEEGINFIKNQKNNTQKY